LCSTFEGPLYIRQTDRPIHVKFQEHFHDYKYVNNKSKFAQHLLDNRHSIGPIENIMDVRGTGKYELYFVRSSKMQGGPLKIVICGSTVPRSFTDLVYATAQLRQL